VYWPSRSKHGSKERETDRRAPFPCSVPRTDRPETATVTYASDHRAHVRSPQPHPYHGGQAQRRWPPNRHGAGRRSHRPPCTGARPGRRLGRWLATANESTTGARGKSARAAVTTTTHHQAVKIFRTHNMLDRPAAAAPHSAPLTIAVI
jgi:hypothetical protein